MSNQSFFATQIYYESLAPDRGELNKINRQLLLEAEEIAALDTSGQCWSKKNYRNGFTSYGSANELHKRSTTFERLEHQIQKHVNTYARSLGWDLGGGKLQMTTCWVNIMGQNAHHSLHLHPLSVVSGTYYVSTPSNTPAIKFEDPRLSKMMASPPVKESARQNQRFVSLPAKAGKLVLFESWLRHEVPMNPAKTPRVSISFNYEWV